MEGAHVTVPEKNGDEEPADVRDVELCEKAWLQIPELSLVLILCPEEDVGPETIIGFCTEESQLVE